MNMTKYSFKEINCTKNDVLKHVLALGKSRRDVVTFEKKFLFKLQIFIKLVLTEWKKTEMFQLDAEVLSNEELSIFLKLYIAECDKLKPGYSSFPENSLETHIKETKVMFLVNFMFFLSMMIKSQDSIIPTIPFDAKKKMVSKKTNQCVFILFINFD